MLTLFDRMATGYRRPKPFMFCIVCRAAAEGLIYFIRLRLLEELHVIVRVKCCHRLILRSSEVRFDGTDQGLSHRPMQCQPIPILASNQDMKSELRYRSFVSREAECIRLPRSERPSASWPLISAFRLCELPDALTCEAGRSSGSSDGRSHAAAFRGLHASPPIHSDPAHA